MKKQQGKLIHAILFLSLLTSCKKLTEFTVSDSAIFTIPAASSLGIPINDTTNVATSSSTEFQANGGDIKNIKEVRLSQLKLTIINPASETFSFLNSIHIYILADGLGEKEIAYLDNISSGVGNIIELVTTDEVLDEYIKKENYSLRIKTVTDEILTQDVEVQADMTFRVRAKLL